MIHFTEGNLLEAPVEALVNTVNEMGVMGKGIALMFREAFPENTHLYQEASRHGGVRVGKMFVTSNSSLFGPRWIINFPTKRHWKSPSRLEWIRDGLRDLAHIIREKDIKSIAVPPLGCGNGGLQWDQVRQEIERALSNLPGVQITVYQPTEAYYTSRKADGLEDLTPARALVAEMVRRYSELGFDCTNLEVQKLAWFLERIIQVSGLDDPLQLNFKPSRYGPYADRLRHLLNGLDGSYLHCKKRLSDAGPSEPIWFESSKEEELRTYLQVPDRKQYQEIIERTTKIIDGFESPFGLELLSTVDWLIAKSECSMDVKEAREALGEWSGGGSAAERKLRLFDDRVLQVALDRLKGSPLCAAVEKTV